MIAAPRLSYVLPVHNQERVLPRTMAELECRLRDCPGSEVLLIENGSTDASAAVSIALAHQFSRPGLAVRVATSARGLGHALRRGMELARGDVIVLTAADLPFGFTDLDALLASNPRPSIAIGSKAHAESRTEVALLRRVMSETFRWLRLVILGLRVGDSQGTILIDARLAARVLPHLRCGDFLISTEIVSWAAAAGEQPVELPVVYTAAGSSTVSPLRDSLRMLMGLFALRRRLQDRLHIEPGLANR